MAKKPTSLPTPATEPTIGEPKWAPRADVLERVKLTRPTLEAQVRAGKIRKTTIGSKVFYSLMDVENLLAANATALRPEPTAA